MSQKRSRPVGEEPWQTFSVRVRVTRGRAEVYAEVALQHVTGIVGSTGVIPRPLWQGVLGRRDAGVPFTPEHAAIYAGQALEKAFPALF